MVTISNPNLVINGVTMPMSGLCSDFSETLEPLWSNDTGRTEAGGMTGTIVAIHRTGTLKWEGISMEEAATIKAAVSNKDVPFPSMSYVDFTGTRQTKNVYFGACKTSLSDYETQSVNVTVDYIEQG